MSTPADILSARSLAITEAAPRRLVPHGRIGRSISWAALDARVRALNASGRLAPGLIARPEHLVFWAAVRALADQPHFNAFYLPAGMAHQAGPISLRLPLDGPGSASVAVLPAAQDLDPGRLAEAIEAWTIEAAGQARAGLLRRVRKRRARPRWHRTVQDPALRSLSWLRDHLGLPRAWIGLVVDRAGSFAAQALAGLGIEAGGGPLVGARLAELSCGAPSPGGPAGAAQVRVGLTWDLRLFEAWEAAAFLQAIDRHLASLDPLDPGGAV